jgi:hypothetical protein
VYRERSAVGWEVEGGHVQGLASTRVVHDTVLASASKSNPPFQSSFSEPMILPAVAARSVQEHNLLLPLTSLLVEDLTLPPKRRLDIDVATNDAVVVQLVLCVFRSGAGEGVVQEFQDATPDVGPACESVLSWLGWVDLSSYSS